MKHFLLILSLLLLPFMLFASNDDLYKSKGTTQDVIVHLSPSPSQEDVSRNVKIEVTFNVSLDAPAIKEYDVKLTYLSSKTNDHIAGTISYSETDKKLTFTPKTSLEPGMYEVEIESLKADKAHKEIKIDELMYRFVVVNEVLQSMTINPDAIELKEGKSLPLEVVGHYDTGVEKDITMQMQWSVADSQIVTVDANATLDALKEGITTVTAKMESIETNMTIVVYKEINGHRLPPEPDPTLNDSTLLGIDSNGNGVRDDVERAIYQKFSKEVRRQILMQKVRAHQAMLSDPDAINDAEKWQKIIANKPIACGSYLFRKFDIEFDIQATEYMEDKLYNNKDRLRKYIEYNHALGGGVYGVEENERVESACEFNVTKALKNDL